MPILPRKDGFYWLVSPAILADNLDKWLKLWLDALDAALKEVSGRILDYAQSQHPWTNITGAAERALVSEVLTLPGGNRAIVLYADPSRDQEGAEHVFWLEVRWNGQWGVIRVALEGHYPDVMNAVKSSLRSVKL